MMLQLLKLPLMLDCISAIDAAVFVLLQLLLNVHAAADIVNVDACGTAAGVTVMFLIELSKSNL